MFENFRIDTDRLLLRLFTLDDAEDCHSILKLEEVVRNINSEVQTLDQVSETLTGLMEKYKRNTPEQFVRLSVAVVWKDTDRIIGLCGLAPIKFDPGDIELYYAFHPDYWNKGIATEVATAMLQFGFKELNLPRIVGLTLPHNQPSSRVLEKIGLIYRWTIHDLPESFCYFEGCNYFSLSKNDYIQTHQ